MKKRNLFIASFLGVTMAILQTACCNSDKNSDLNAYYEGVPFEITPLARPQIPSTIYCISDFGAIGDGTTDNTEAINRAIRTASENGGGRVIIPEGVWFTGPIALQSNVDLHTEYNALVVFNSDPKAYPIIETSFEGLNARRCTSPISARQAENIALTGHGVFDGSGDDWRYVKREKMTDAQWASLLAKGGILNPQKTIWYPSEESYRGHQVSDKFNNPQNLTKDEEWESIRQWLRPVMVSFIDCKNVLIEDVTVRNTPCWALHPLSCENIIIKNVKVFNPWYSQNGDALDLESCNNALIIENLFDAGDDGICVKSGKDKDGRDRNQPCQNVVIRDNAVLHAHGGFVVGSEMSGGVKNVFVANCTFTGTDVGLRFKSTRGRGGVVENIYIQDINMCNIPTEALLFDLHYNGKSAVENLGRVEEEETEIPAVTEETPAFRNIHIKDVTCRNARRAMYFNGLPEMNIQNVTVENVTVTSKIGVEVKHTDGVTFTDNHITVQEGPVMTFKHAKNITVDGDKIIDADKHPVFVTK